MAETAEKKAGWQKVALGDVVRQVKDIVSDPLSAGTSHYVPGGGISADSFKITQWEPMNDGVMGPAFHMRFLPGHVLYKSRVPHGVAVADRVGLCANTTFVLEPSGSGLLLELLPFILITERFHAFEEATNKGSTNRFLNFSDIAKYEFALPPLEAQRRIAEVQGAIQDYIDALYLGAERISDARSAFFAQSILGPHASESSGELNAQLLRSGWRLVPAHELSRALITKGATPSAELTNVDTGIPFLKVYNLTFDGTLDFSIDPTFVTPTGHKDLRRSTVRPGDILMNIVGPPLGKVSLVPNGFPECNINQAIVRFRPTQDGLSKWLAGYLLSSLAQDWLMARSKKTSGQRNLTLETCRELPVPLPPDDALHELISQLAVLDASTIRLKTRIGQTLAMRGELTSATLELGDV